MSSNFVLEFYFEHPGDEELVRELAVGLEQLVAELAPKMKFDVNVLPVAVAELEDEPCRLEDGGGTYPVKRPQIQGHQALVLTNQTDRWQGYAGEERGCVTVRRVVAKKEKGGNPVDIVIHEWLHTMYNQDINGWRVPPVHDDKR